MSPLQCDNYLILKTAHSVSYRQHFSSEVKSKERKQESQIKSNQLYLYSADSGAGTAGISSETQSYVGHSGNWTSRVGSHSTAMVQWSPLQGKKRVEAEDVRTSRMVGRSAGEEAHLE